MLDFKKENTVKNTKNFTPYGAMNYAAFFEGREPDDKNRMITDFLKYSTWHLESSHDYIQRIFPLQEESRFSDASLITDAEIKAIKASKVAQENIREVYKKMLWFWKIDDVHLHKWGFSAPIRLWNEPNNHNCLRMTRVLKSLKLLGMENEYQDFSERLSYIISLRGKGVHISRETAQIWKENMDKQKE
jgi:hypothetical protein